MLRRCVPGPGEYRLRRADHESRSGLHRLAIRFRRRHLLPRLRPVRVAQQPDAGSLRRPALDRPHPDHLGRAVGDHRLGLEPGQLLHRARAARRGGGRVLPRHHLHHDVVVPQARPRRHVRPVQHRRADFIAGRRPGVGVADRTSRRRRRSSRLAMDVPAGGCPGGDHGPGRPVRFARHARRRPVPDPKRTHLAHRPAERRTRPTGSPRPFHRHPGADRSARAADVPDLRRPGDGHHGDRDLDAAIHPQLRTRQFAVHP